jgi:glycosyltransferase involved in cell wall biosynthesis
MKNIGIISTRIAGTDGVSLEIQKWVTVLERNGYNCFYFAGELDRDMQVSFLSEEAHFDHPAIKDISDSVFGVIKRSPDTSDKIRKLKDKLKQDLYAFHKKFDIDLIIPENALTIPMNIPLGLAITEYIAETNICTIAHHHDFYWERDRFLINACQDYINKAFPTDLPCIQHVVINSLASEQLSHRLGISNMIIPNVYDFNNVPPPADEYSKTLRDRIGLGNDDLFVLQPTRIVPRKWIERSIEIVNRLALKKPVLVISHATGDEGEEYYQRIMEYARNLKVEIVAIDHLIGDKRGTNNDGEKIYSISDLYQQADLVTYPSGYEGFGNAFLETIYFKRPIVVNRYSIFIVDIEPKGFDVLVVRGFVASRIIGEIKKVLADKERLERMTAINYKLARKHFSFEVLEEKLLYLIHTIERARD